MEFDAIKKAIGVIRDRKNIDAFYIEGEKDTNYSEWVKIQQESYTIALECMKKILDQIKVETPIQKPIEMPNKKNPKSKEKNNRSNLKKKNYNNKSKEKTRGANFKTNKNIKNN